MEDGQLQANATRHRAHYGKT